MSAPTSPACPLGISADDLSAWRDRALAPAEEQRIAAHIGGCPACQRIIAAHETLAAAVRAEQPPAPDTRAWPQLHARIAATRQPRRASATPMASHAPRRAVWGGLGAAAAVLLLSALFIHLFAQQALVRGGSSHHKTAAAATPAPLSTVAPTAPIAGPALSWQSYMAPESVIPPPGNQTYNNGFAFSPTDASTAYICATTNAIGAPNTIWATHDGAQTWTHVSDLPYTSEVADCGVTVDATDPLRVNVIVSEQGVPSAVSDDGGKTWRTLSDDMQLVGLSTRGDTSVAVTTPWDFARGNPITPGQATREPRLSVSHDDWRTWQPIDGALVARGYSVTRVWQRPGDGALLVEAAARSAPATPSATNGPDAFPQYTYSLWQSADLGAHWAPLPTPPNLIANQGFAVAPPTGAEPWRVCGFTLTGSGATRSELIGCTLDGGQTWTSRPLPALKAPDGSGHMLQDTVETYQAALLSDGTLVAVMYAGPQSVSAVETLSMFHIFRLPPGSDQWQDLGSQPGNALVIIPGAMGTLVSYSGGGSMDGYGGELVGHLGGDIPNRGALAIATLP